MAPVIAKEDKTWKEKNKVRKEERKKRKEEKLMKKFKKLESQTQAPNNKSEISNSSENNNFKEISTISIAVPGSILDNAQSLTLQTLLASQIARAASIFQVDEVIIYDDCGDLEGKKVQVEDANGLKTAKRCCVRLCRILQYLECPQYLRKFFFPIHGDLQFAGILPPLDSPHHLRENDVFKFREGIVTNKPVKPGRGSAVNVGLQQDVLVDKLLTPGIRVTVKIHPRDPTKEKKIKGEIVSPLVPRRETGVYWGYTTRLADSLSQVFAQCPYKKGYDLTIGTSDKGTSVDDLEQCSFQHALVVFGGLQGIEAAIESDNRISIDDPSLLFDHYLNVLPKQGSRTIRTEEAIPISLTALRTKIHPKNEPNLIVDENIIGPVIDQDISSV